jgi:hypothetical protein
MGAYGTISGGQLTKNSQAVSNRFQLIYLFKNGGSTEGKQVQTSEFSDKCMKYFLQIMI